MTKRNKKIITAVLLLTFVVFWFVLLFFYTPREIVTKVGITNGYMLVFFIAVIGSITSLTTFTIYPMIVTFALGSLHPLFLGLIAGAGLTLGDAIFFYIGFESRVLIAGDWKDRLSKFLGWLLKRPWWFIPGTVYLYVGFTPFPNNILTAALALSGYPIRKIMVPLFLGDLTLPLIAAYAAVHGVDLFK